MDVPTISNSEVELLKVLWHESPLTGPELVARVRTAKPEWEENTVKTLLVRLVNKKAVSQEGRRRFYLYTPLVTREEYREETSQKFAELAFDNSPAEMLTFFVQRGKLSGKDVKALKKLLDEVGCDD